MSDLFLSFVNAYEMSIYAHDTRYAREREIYFKSHISLWEEEEEEEITSFQPHQAD